MRDEELDQQLAALGGVEPPRALQARILADVGVSPHRIAEVLGTPSLVVVSTPSVTHPDAAAPPASWGRGAKPPRNAPPSAVRSPSRRYIAAVVGALALAAAILLALPAPPTVGDPADLVARGSGEVLPELGLRVAVRRGGTSLSNPLERLSAGRSYRAGDTLLFRVSVKDPMEITLRRNDVVLYRGTVPAGDSDLPVGYALEAGEGPATFTVQGGGATDVVSHPGVAP